MVRGINRKKEQGREREEKKEKRWTGKGVKREMCRERQKSMEREGARGRVSKQSQTAAQDINRGTAGPGV